MNALVANEVSVVRGDNMVVAKASFEIEAGTLLGVVGPNGAGKSSLLAALAGLLPFSGTARYGAADIAAASARNLASLRSFTAADVASDLACTVGDYVEMAYAHHDKWFVGARHEDNLEQTLAALGISALKDRPLCEVSSGERQLAAVAQAFVEPKALYFLDEPTSHLDMGARQKVHRMLQRAVSLSQQTPACVVWAVHDLNEAARVCTHMMLLAAGRIIALGDPRVVLTPENLYRVFGVETHVYLHPVLHCPVVDVVGSGGS